MTPWDLLTSEIMRYPLIIAVLMGLTAPIVGTYLVQKRLSLLGDGLGHVSLTGVAIGWLVGAWLQTDPNDLLAVPGALIASVIGALLIEFVREVGHTSRDVAMAILFYGGIAGGVVIIQLAGGTSTSLMGYLFGSLATVTGTDLVISVVLAVIVLAVGLGLSRLLYAVTSDEEFARASGLPVRAVNVLIALIAALTVTLAMRIIGALMVSALMIVPVAAAQTMVVGFTRTMRTAMGIGVVCSFGGLVLTAYVDLPPGGVIVLIAIAIYAIGLVVRAIREHVGSGRAVAAEATDEAEGTDAANGADGADGADRHGPLDAARVRTR
ncbi:metal ABC transporter permease [Brachybacterium huguangmaarense]|uniref:metal ABC transporter permease n=1 Tax=Brachybacterium huguangmaarense TaxID=1652028 RepID=UPI0037BEEE45